MKREWSARPCHWFIVPELTGPTTGGTLYNHGLIRALSDLKYEVKSYDLARAASRLATANRTRIWVDTLYLEAVPMLRGLARAGENTVGLLVHYLPTLVAAGGPVEWTQLRHDEQRALSEAEAFIVTSSYMAHVLEGLGITDRPLLVLEPGRGGVCLSDERVQAQSIEAVMIANLLPGKGVLPFLSELGAAVACTDQFRLVIVGNRALDPDYAGACERLVGDLPELAKRVRFAGELSSTAVQAKLAASDLLVSASTMESYGMSLAEARTVGLPIVAHRGGNVEHLVRDESGGEVVISHAELTRSFLALVRNPRLLSERRVLAQCTHWSNRDWLTVAREFIALTQHQ